MVPRSSGDGRAALARLCAYLQKNADAEKRKLARALHDSPAQTVSAALLTLFLLEREKSALSVPAQRALQDAQSLLAACGEELRRMSHDLYPPLLDEVGLQPPLRTLTRKSSGRLRLELPDELPRMGPLVEEAAYRFVEESLAHLMSPRGTVKVDLDMASPGALLIVMEGQARAGESTAAAWLALQQRVRSVGGSSTLVRRRGRLRLEARFRAARTARKTKSKSAAPGVSGDRGTAPTGGSVKRQRLQQKDAPARRRPPLVKDPAPHRNNT